MATNWSLPPAPDEIEVTLLGRGFGDSIVLHLGGGEWAVIDSLTDGAGMSAPLEYLRSLGVRPDAVTTIIATHWHDDHVKGLSQVCAWASNASLFMPFVRNMDELARYVNDYKAGSAGKVSGGTDELSTIMRIQDSEGRHLPIQCQANLLLKRKTLPTFGQMLLLALSPSTEDLRAFLATLTANPPLNKRSRRLVAKSPNHVSVVVWIEFDNDAILLGADLEEVTSPASGWKAIVASHDKSQRSASLYKVAHHGGVSAHNDDVWKNMLTPSPHAIITPFSKGKGLPSAKDRQRILGLAPKALVTNKSPFRRNKDRSSEDRKARAVEGLEFRTVDSQLGLVRSRRLIGTSHTWNYDLQGQACTLTEFACRDG